MITKKGQKGKKNILLKKARKIPCTALLFVVGLAFSLIHCVSIHIIVVKIIFIIVIALHLIS